jgi:mono/diheme cytochrome c family protein
MSKLAKGLILLAALLTAPKVQATDPARPFEGGAVAPASAQPDPTLPAPDGATLFAQHCAVCHKQADLVRRVQGAGDAETAKASLTTFLGRHGRADAAADAAIIDWLLNGNPR